MLKIIDQLFEHQEQDKNVIFVSDTIEADLVFKIDSIKPCEDCIKLHLTHEVLGGLISCHIKHEFTYSKEEDDEFDSITYYFHENEIERLSLTFF